MSTSDNTFNSDHFDMTKWYLTLPVDAEGGITGTALNIQKPVGYESAYFYDAPDGGMVFMSPVIGATTTHTYGTRSELRELNSDGSYAFWNLAQGGTMTATLAINSVPFYDDGTMGKQIIGQIHGSSNELVRLYYEKGTIYFKNDRSGTTNTEHKFLLTDANGNTPHIALGEKFSYVIDAHGSTLTVKVITADDVYSSVTTINDYWQTDGKLYFKAGVYLGVTNTEDVDVPHGYGYGQDTFYGLDFSHTAGQGYGGLIDLGSGTDPGTSDPDPIPGTISGTTGNDRLDADHDSDTVLNGLAGNDYLVGHDGNDTLNGGDGADTLYGYWGDDTINGGTGNDVATGSNGHDTFIVAKGDNGLTINDFTVNDAANSDKVVLKGFSLTDLAGATLTQSGVDAVLTFQDGTTVTFHNLTVGALNDTNLLADINGTLGGFFADVLSSSGGGSTDGSTATGGGSGAPSTAVTINGTDAAEKLDADHEKDSTVNGLGGNDTISGHDGNDVLYGGDGSDTVHGYWGNDWIEGGAGNDKLYGETGDDTIIGGAGGDTATGGVGNDTFISNRGDGSMTITDFTTSGDKTVLKGYSAADLSGATISQSGTDAVLKFVNGDIVTFHNVATTALTDSNLLVDVSGTLDGYFHARSGGGTSSGGSAGSTATADPVTSLTVTGTSSADKLNANHDIGTTVHGLGGNDSVIGHDGNDVLYGDDGSDKLYGYWGNDFMVGGLGADTMTGGPGNDTFKIRTALEGGDIITDFHHLTGDNDMLDLTALFDANGLGAVGTSAAIQNGYLVLSQHTDGLHVDFDKDGAAGSGAVVHLVTLSGTDQQHLDVVHQILTTTLQGV